MAFKWILSLARTIVTLMLEVIRSLKGVSPQDKFHQFSGAGIALAIR